MEYHESFVFPRHYKAYADNKYAFVPFEGEKFYVAMKIYCAIDIDRMGIKLQK